MWNFAISMVNKVVQSQNKIKKTIKIDFVLEISGLEPETKICKINVLPIKPYPLACGMCKRRYTYIFFFCNCITLVIKVIQETTWTFTVIYQRILRSLCLPIPALGLILIFYKNVTYLLSCVFVMYATSFILRLEWFEHSSELSWAVCFTNYAIAFYISI